MHSIIYEEKEYDSKFDDQMNIILESSQKNKKIDKNNQKLKIIKRPYLDEFLKKISELYEIIIFTTQNKKYSKQIVEYIDNQKVIKSVLSQEHCITMEIQNDKGNHYYLVKDLRVITDRNLNNIIFVDNNIISYSHQLHNAIPIVPFYDFQEDNELLKLMLFLIQIHSRDDFQFIVDSHFDTQKLFQY